jgi:hypothetical protein
MSAHAVRRWVMICLLSATLFAAACGGGAAIISPVSVQAGRTPQQTEQAILDALPKRGWTAESVQPGRIVAFLSIRSHLLRTELRYDASQVYLFYVDSDNLAAHVEADGRIYAHGNVNKWMQNLARDIAEALAVSPLPGTAGGYYNTPAPMTPPPPAPTEAPNAGLAPPPSTGLAAPAQPLAH